MKEQSMSKDQAEKLLLQVIASLKLTKEERITLEQAVSTLSAVPKAAKVKE